MPTQASDNTLPMEAGWERPPGFCPRVPLPRRGSPYCFWSPTRMSPACFLAQLWISSFVASIFALISKAWQVGRACCKRSGCKWSALEPGGLGNTKRALTCVWEPQAPGGLGGRRGQGIKGGKARAHRAFQENATAACELSGGSGSAATLSP